MKIFVATPMYGGMCTGQYTTGMLNLVVAGSQRGHEIMYSKIYNESLITRARNALVHEFLNTDCDGLLFIDADEGFVASEVLKMVESGKDLIGGVYPMKAINWDSVRRAISLGKENLENHTGFFGANFLPNEDGTITITLDEPMPVDNVSTGMMYLSRRVFTELADKVDVYKSNAPTGEIIQDTWIKEFFKTEIDENGVLLSEDFYICRRWTELGHTVYAAPWVQVTHYGSYEFQGSFAESIIAQYEYEERAKTSTAKSPKSKKSIGQ